MSETVVADFAGRFHTAETGSPEPVTGRILLSRKRLVLATDNTKTTIPLSAVIDANVGTVPGGLEAFFSDTITVAYKQQGTNQLAIIEATGDNVERFKTVFFKVLLGGLTVIVKHPAKRGGRVTDTADEKMTLALKSGTLALTAEGTGFTIDLGSIIDFSREQRQLGGKTRPTLSVDHSSAGTTLTTLISLPNGRKLNLLGRFLRLEYSEIMEEVTEISVTEEQLEILVSLYSAGGSAPLKQLVTGDVNQTTIVLDRLREKGLVTDSKSALELTPKGQVIVSNEIEAVNT